MKMYPGINYLQRPQSYWEDGDALACILRNVKGTERRALIVEQWEQGRLQEMPEELLKEALSVEARDALGRIHPVCMGGEYLPDYVRGEVEIARLELRSTTADVISVRARRGRGPIRYRIVDEYGTEFALPRKTSRRPLTLSELITFINGSRAADLEGSLALCYNNMNAPERDDREAMRHFTTVKSDIYPQLEEHYEHVFDDWVEESI